jgi:hypothetical protein
VGFSAFSGCRPFRFISSAPQFTPQFMWDDIEPQWSKLDQLKAKI